MFISLSVRVVSNHVILLFESTFSENYINLTKEKLGGFPDGASGKELACWCRGDIRDVGSVPGLGRYPWKRACQPTPVFLPGESHEQRSLAGYVQFTGLQRVEHDGSYGKEKI